MLTMAALAALAAGLQAGAASFEKALSELPAPSAVSDVPAPAPAEADPQPAAPVEREWLVMVFINGVNDLGILGFANADVNEMEAVGSTDKVAVVAELGALGVEGGADRNLQFQRGSRTLYITRDTDASVISSSAIYTSNSSDMGSEANLVRFVKRGLRAYPARKVALVLWNHGNGMLGISSDDVSRNAMEIDSLGRALAQVKAAIGHNIDVLAMDACLMQMAGVAYEFHGHADVIVASEEIISGPGYPYTPILASLTADPGMDAEELGSVIVDAFGAAYRNDATLSALRASAMPGFLGALNNWVMSLRMDRAAFAAAASPALTASVSRFRYRDSKDLIDYVNKVGASRAVGPGVKQAGEALKDYIARGLVIRSVARPAGNLRYTAAAGLAIYLPDLRYDSANYERLAFSADSLWDDLLLEIMNERLK